MSKGRRYTVEFRQEVVEQVAERVYSATEVAMLILTKKYKAVQKFGVSTWLIVRVTMQKNTAVHARLICSLH